MTTRPRHPQDCPAGENLYAWILRVSQQERMRNRLEADRAEMEKRADIERWRPQDPPPRKRRRE